MPRSSTEGERELLPRNGAANAVAVADIACVPRCGHNSQLAIPARQHRLGGGPVAGVIDALRLAHRLDGEAQFGV